MRFILHICLAFALLVQPVIAQSFAFAMADSAYGVTSIETDATETPMSVATVMQENMPCHRGLAQKPRSPSDSTGLKLACAHCCVLAAADLAAPCGVRTRSFTKEKRSYLPVNQIKSLGYSPEPEPPRA